MRGFAKTVRRDWKPILLISVSAVGALWGITEFVDFAVGWQESSRAILLPLYLAIGSAIGFRFGRRPSTYRLDVPGSNTTLTIESGDLFDQSGCIGIAVNDCFDYVLGTEVSAKSVHGQFLAKVFGGDERQAKAALDAALAEKSSTPVVRRLGGSNKRYPVGTVGTINAGEDSYLLVALTRTDATTNKVEAEIDDLTLALAELWAAASAVAGERRVAIPLIGGGLSKVGLPLGHTLLLVVSSLVVATRESRVSGDIRIVLRPDDLDRVDLRGFGRLLST